MDSLSDDTTNTCELTIQEVVGGDEALNDCDDDDLEEEGDKNVISEVVEDTGDNDELVMQIQSELTVNKEKSEFKPKKVEVTCPYCEHLFDQELSRELLSYHLEIVHFVSKNLDLLLDFTVKNFVEKRGGISNSNFSRYLCFYTIIQHIKKSLML